LVKELDLVSIGSANIDLIIMVDRFAGPDEELSAKALKMEGGGSAANVAVSASRLGLKTGFIGKIGEDPFGSILENSFIREKVEISHLKKEGRPTGIAVSIVNWEGERSIYAYNETNLEFTERDLDATYIESSHCIYLSSMQGEEAFKAIKHACDIAYNLGVNVFFDPGCILAEKGLDKLKEPIGKSTVLKLNREEVEMLTGFKDLEKASDTILNVGPEIVLITLGQEGCYVRNNVFSKIIPGYKSFKAVDRTGAGDSFNAAFIAAFTRGLNLEECIKFGNLVAGISVTKTGARSTPTLKELKAYKGYSEFEGVFN
jgi:ribokinase